MSSTVASRRNRWRFAAIAWALGVFALIAAPLDAREPAKAEVASLVDVVVEEMLLDQVAKSWQKGFTAPTTMPRCQCSPEQQEKFEAAWRTAVGRQFDTDSFLREFRTALSTRLSVAELREIVAFRRTPIGQRMKRAEERDLIAGENPDQFMSDLARARSGLDSDPNRRNAIHRILGKSGGTKSLVDLTINIMLGTALGTVAALPADQPRPDVDALVREVESARGSMTKALEPIAVGVIASRYSGFSMDELSVIEGELDRPSGKKFIELAIDVMNESLRAHAIALGSAFAKALAEERL